MFCLSNKIHKESITLLVIDLKTTQRKIVYKHKTPIINLFKHIQEVNMTKQIRIASYNISGGFYIGNEDEEYLDREAINSVDNKLLYELINTINNENIDILCLQEVITTPHVKYIEQIANATSLKYYDSFELSPCNIVKDTEAGIAIMSKYPLHTLTKQLFPNPRIAFTTSSGNTYYTYDKGYMVCEVEIDNNKIKVFNHHNFPFRRFRSTARDNMLVFEHFDSILKKENPDAVMGDFNTEDFMDLVPTLNTFYNRTINTITTVDGMSFDEILLRNKSNTKGRLIRGLSDHYMVTTTLNI